MFRLKLKLKKKERKRKIHTNYSYKMSDYNSIYIEAKPVRYIMTMLNQKAIYNNCMFGNS